MLRPARDRRGAGAVSAPICEALEVRRRRRPLICNVAPARLSSRHPPARRPLGRQAYMARDIADGEIVESRDALAAWFEAGCKPNGRSASAPNTKRFSSTAPNHSPVPYEGERGIAALLEGHERAARLGADRGRRPSDRPLSNGERGGDFARAGRPVRTVGRARSIRRTTRPRSSTRHLELIADRSREPLGIRRSVARHEPEMDAGRDPDRCRRAATAS